MACVTRPAGFTLLELLVSIAIFGFLCLGLSQSTHFSGKTFLTLMSVIDESEGVDTTIRSLRHVITQLEPKSELQPSQFVGGPNSFTFVGSLPNFERTHGLHRGVGSVGVVDGRLILHWQPAPAAQWFGSEGAAQEKILLTGLYEIKFAYLQATEEREEWLENWTSDNLPRAIKVTLLLRQERSERWPEIIFIPKLSKW